LSVLALIFSHKVLQNFLKKWFFSRIIACIFYEEGVEWMLDISEWKSSSVLLDALFG